MTRLLASIALAAPASETDTPLSWKEAVGFLLVTSLVMTAGFLLRLEFFLMLIALGGLAALIVLRSPITWLALAIGGHLPVFIVMSSEFTVIEGAHATIYYVGMIWWFFHRLVIVGKPLRWTLGGAVSALLLLQLVLLTPVSLSYGATPYALFRDIWVMASVLLLIPIAHEADTRMKQKIIGGAMVLVLFGLSVKNIYAYKQKVVEAVYYWQVGASRSADTFFFIFVAAVLGAAMLISSHRLRSWLGWAALFVAGSAATILSFYRTLWVAAMVSLFTMGVMMGTVFWKRAIRFVAIGLILLAGLYPLFLQEYIPLDVMWSSISTRFESIGDYGQDISVRNRDAEAMAALNTVDGHWVLGKGVGVPLHFFKIITQETIHTTWTHNGYAWILRHYGIIGTLLLFTSYFAYIVLGFRLERRLRSWPGLDDHVRFRWRTIVACGVSLIIATMLISFTINQFISRESGIIFAVVFGLFEAWRNELLPPADSGAA